ncbi:MAG: DUF3140 domain-containing protein [Janthinobacterium lividum]
MTGHVLSDDDKAKVRADFRDAVNMTPAELRRWLDTEDSRSVGMTQGGERVSGPGGKEAVGHHMGYEILALHDLHQDRYGEAEYDTMRKVTGYVHRHTAQRPHGDVTDSRWRQSLMNWGHDPLK